MYLMNTCYTIESELAPFHGRNGLQLAPCYGMERLELAPFHHMDEWVGAILMLWYGASSISSHGWIGLYQLAPIYSMGGL